MPTSAIAAMNAANAAAAAANNAAAQEAAERAHREACKAIIVNYKPDASVPAMQEYSQCVLDLYPIETPELHHHHQMIVLVFLIAAAVGILIGGFIGQFSAYDMDRINWWEILIGSFVGLFVGPIALFFVVGILVAIRFVIS